MGDQRERNRIKSRVDELPDEIRAQLDAMLADVNYTYQDIADTITDLGYEISRSAVLDQYETMLNAQLLDLAAQEEVVLTDIELLLETDEKSGSYGSVLYVLARVSEGEEGQTTALIRRLAVQWNMPEENINLHSGQGGGNYGY